MAMELHLVLEILHLTSILVDAVLTSESDVKTGTDTAAATSPSNRTPATPINAFAAGRHFVNVPPARLQKKAEVFYTSIVRVIYLINICMIFLRNIHNCL